MSEKRVYLGGAVTGLTWGDCTNWREYAKKELAKYKIIGISPMRFKEFSEDNPFLKIIDLIANDERAVTNRCRNDVRESSCVLFNLLGAKEITKGTLIEYGWADAFGKPIISIMEGEGNLHDHKIVRAITNYRVDNLDSGILVARAILGY